MGPSRSQDRPPHRRCNKRGLRIARLAELATTGQPAACREGDTGSDGSPSPVPDSLTRLAGAPLHQAVEGYPYTVRFARKDALHAVESALARRSASKGRGLALPRPNPDRPVG